MGRPELGTKRTDPETGRKFYDLGKDPIVSPYTGNSYPLSFFDLPSAPSRYSSTATKPVHREENQDADNETDDEDADTVSLNDIEDDGDAGSKPEAIDPDDDEEAEKDDDTLLALDEDDDAEDVDDLLGEQGDDDD